MDEEITALLQSDQVQADEFVRMFRKLQPQEQFEAATSVVRSKHASTVGYHPWFVGWCRKYRRAFLKKDGPFYSELPFTDDELRAQFAHKHEEAEAGLEALDRFNDYERKLQEEDENNNTER